MDGRVRKQNALSLKVKLQLLQAVDAGCKSKTDICRKFGIPNSTLSTIIKNREKITSVIEGNKYELERKRLRTSKHHDLESALLIWINQIQAQNVPVSGAVLMRKADTLAKDLGIEFSSNPGWLERFKRRNGIVLKGVSGESSDVTTATKSDRIRSILPTLRKNYEAKNVFIAVGTGIFFGCLPENILDFKDKKCSDGSFSDERITVLLACNSDGSEKLPLLVIGKYQNPRCFKNVEKLPLEYTANENVWVTANVFTDWVKTLDQCFSREKREIALIVDNIPTDWNVDELKYIKVIFLPLNTRPMIKLCGQRIITNLKFYYRELMLKKYLSSLVTKDEFRPVTILDSLHFLRTAWRSITARTIVNCFHHAGFYSTQVSDPLVEENEGETKLATPKVTPDECDLYEIFGRLSFILNLPSEIEVNDYVTVDDQVVTLPILTESDIVNVVRATTPIKSEIADDDDQMVGPPSASDIRRMLKGARRFLETQSDGEKMYEVLDDLEQYVEQKIIIEAIHKKNKNVHS